MKLSFARLLLRPAGNLVLGAVTAMAGSYLASKVKESGESDLRIDRLEQIVDKLIESEAAKSDK